MKRIVGMVVALGVLVPSAAFAGGYVAAGVGGGADISGDLGDFRSDGHYNGRLMVGQRFTFVSLEAGLNGYGLEGVGAEWDAVSLSGALKLSIPMVLGFELFARAGVERTWLGPSGDLPMQDWAGNGYLIGGGAEYRFDLTPTDLSLWADWTRHDTNLHDGNARADARVDLWTAGLSIAL